MTAAQTQAPRPPSKLLAEIRDLSLHYGMRALPTTACSALGAWFGTNIGQRGHPVAHARSREVLTRLRPDLAATPEALEANLHVLWQNVGRTYAEFACVERILAEGRSEMIGREYLDEVCTNYRPLILCFFHLGNWEVLGLQAATHPMIDPDRPITAVIMPPANRAHALIAERRRAVLPVKLVEMGPRVWQGVSETLRRRGGVVWLAGDDVAKGRVSAPHLGRQPRIDGNLGKIVRLAAAHGARIMPMYSERVGPAQFRSHIMEPLEVPHGRLSDDAILAEVMRLDAIFDPIVRALVTQWYMAIEFGSDPDDPVIASPA